ncbi:MAG: ABC transporter ATP-binding protein [Rubripirellula sp.]
MTAVRLHGIAQTFAGKPVLCGLELDIGANEYMVLLGASGCGKTTTLRIIAGLQRPDAGDVFFNDQKVTAVAPRHRDVAMVFQQDGLYPHLTVRQSIQFALKGKYSRDEIAARSNEAIELAGIAEILDRFPDRLSGGELRRASIAKAIARRCSVRLLDEPLSALDVPVRHLLQEDILHWHQAVPGTTVHVTHDGQEAMRMADKIAVMHAGAIIQCGTPKQVYEQPQSIRVATAIGSPPINLMSGAVDNGQVQLASDVSFVGLKLPDDAPAKVTVGVRPGSFQLSRPTGEPGMHLSVVPDRTTAIGRETQLQFAVGAGRCLAIIPEHVPSTNSSVRLFVPLDQLHVFDPQTETRISLTQ